jgi:acyl carrier protein
MSSASSAAVAEAIRSVLRDTGRTAGPLEGPMTLAGDLGLDSLDLAQTVVILERTLGVDPFRATSADAGRPVLRTFDDLCGIYDAALSELESAQPDASQKISEK